MAAAELDSTRSLSLFVEIAAGLKFLINPRIAPPRVFALARMNEPLAVDVDRREQRKFAHCLDN